MEGKKIKITGIYISKSPKNVTGIG